MPSKKWHTSRCISSKEGGRSRGKGSGLTDKGKRRRAGTPPQTLALPILSNPVLQRSNSRASIRSASATMASLAHSRALRPTSPARASSTSPRNFLGARPRSRSLPVSSTTFPMDKKRLRRLTLAPTSGISRILFDCENKENTLPLKEEEAKKTSDSPVQKADPIAVEMKTPEFHSSPSVDGAPQFLPLPPCEHKEDALEPSHVLRITDADSPQENDCEILSTKRFDVLLSFVAPPTRFVGIDIDDTVVITNHAPSILLTTCGVSSFQRYVNQKFSDFKKKNALCRELEKAVKDKVLVEPKIPSVIRDLQDSGCWVFGVTARYHEMAASTDKCLSSLGINLSLTSPFPSQILRDPKTGAVCVNGIIYCNGLSKGMVLNRFFENVVLRNVLQAKGNKDVPAGSLPGQKTSSSSSSSSTASPKNRPPQENVGLPDRFVFIDDQRSQAECICKDLVCARTLNIPVTCYHYVPEILRDPCEKMDRVQRGHVLLKQMIHFIEKKVVLSNQEALQLLKMGSSSTTTQQQPQPHRQSLNPMTSSGTPAATKGSGSTHESVHSADLRQILSGIPTSTATISASPMVGFLKRDMSSASTTKVAKIQGKQDTKVQVPR